MSLSANSHNLLLVDDDPTFCTVMSNAMRRRGFHVAVAHNVAEAKVMATKRPPEYALVDLKMPGLNGLGTIALLRVIFPDIAIIALSHNDDAKSHRAVVAVGGNDLVSKMSMQTDLMPAIRRALPTEEEEEQAEPLPSEYTAMYLRQAA